MFKNTNVVAMAFGTLTVCSILALGLLSPVSAKGSFEASQGYMPDEVVNQGQTVESVPADAYGDNGLSKSFPKEDPAVYLDATPEMYS